MARTRPKTVPVKKHTRNKPSGGKTDIPKHKRTASDGIKSNNASSKRSKK